MEKYIYTYTVYAFRRLFCSDANKELLLSLLNAILEGRECLTSVLWVRLGRLAYADFCLQNSSGEAVLVELQFAEAEFFVNNPVPYASSLLANCQVQKVYTIGILNFIFDTKTPSYIHHEALFDVETREPFYDKLKYIYIEMPKFTKSESELVTIKDKWLYAIKNLNTLIDRPRSLQDAVFQRLFQQAEIAMLSPEEMHNYRESQKDFWDYCSVVETAERKGRAQGRAEGLVEGRAEGLAQDHAEGRAEEIISIAKNLKAAGFPVSAISQATGISEEEIARL